MIYRVEIPGVRPPSLNERTELVKVRGRLRPKVTKAARDYQATLRLVALQQLKRLGVRSFPLFPKGTPVAAIVEVYGAQAMDGDNLLKDTLDAMSRRRARKNVPAAPGVLWHDDKQLVSSPPCFPFAGPARVVFHLGDARCAIARTKLADLWRQLLAGESSEVVGRV